jgi:glycosyltransferase involved in cell wall biosynthesis
MQINTPWLRELVAACERRALLRADHAISVADGDRRHFASQGVDTTLIPNCVDPRRLEYSLPVNSESLLRELFDIDLGERPAILFVGASHPPNTEAALEIQRMASAFGESDSAAPLFVVAGSCLEPGRSENFLSLGSLDELALSALYDAAALVLIPLLDGTGMSLKTVEAMALGKAIIGTRVGFRSIPIKNGIEAIVEDDLAEYPQLVAQLLADNSTRRSLGGARRTLLPSHSFFGMP